MRTKKEEKQIHPPSSESVVLGALVTNIGSDGRPEIHNCKLDSAAALQLKVTLTGLRQATESQLHPLWEG